MTGAARSRLTRVAIALGSNLGERRLHLSWAIEALRAGLRRLRVSPLVETTPVGVPDAQPDYLNAVAVGYTRSTAEQTLAWLLALERARGRVRTGPKSARTLDLDLILFGDEVRTMPHLTVPHPRFRERAFVLGPLAALAPRWRDPVTGETVQRLWRSRRLPGRGEAADAGVRRRTVSVPPGRRARRRDGTP